jgi:hypothetical protein
MIVFYDFLLLLLLIVNCNIIFILIYNTQILLKDKILINFVKMRRILKSLLKITPK